MSVEVEKLLVTLEARIDGYSRNLLQAQQQTNQQLTAIEGRFSQMSASVKGSAESASAGVGEAFAGIGAYLSAETLISYANAWTRVTRSLETSAREYGIVLKPASEINKLASESLVDLEDYAKLFTRTAGAVKNYGFSAEDAAKFTTAFSQSLKFSGDNAIEQASALYEVSHSLQRGVLNGLEFRSLQRSAPLVIEQLAKNLDVAKSKLIELVHAGQVPSIELFKAVLAQAPEIRKEFEQMPKTVEEAFLVLHNHLAEYVGEAGSAGGVTQGLAQGIVGLANHLDALAIAGGAILSATTLRMAAFAAASIAAINPLTAIALALGAIGSAYEIFGDKVALSDDGLVTIRGSLVAFFETIGESDALKKFEDLAKEAFGSAKSEISSLGDEVSKLDAALGGYGHSFVGWVESAASAAARAVGLTDAVTTVAERARNDALAAKAASQQFGFGGAGFTNYLENTNRNPIQKAPLKEKEDGYSKATDAIKKRIAELDAQIATINQTTFAQDKAKASADLLTAAQAAAAKEGTSVTAARRAQIEKLATAYANAKVQAQFLASLQSQREGIEVSRSELSLIGLYGQALEEATIKLQLLNEAKKRGVALTPRLQAQIGEIAANEAALKTYTDAVKELQTVSKDALSGFINDLRSGKSAAEALGNVLNKLADALVSKGVDALITAASGPLLGKGSGFASLFGFASGGIMIPGRGPANLPRFAGGGVSSSAAIFGEAGPEAAIPLPDGRSVPVTLKGGGGQNINISIDARNSTPQAVDSLNNTTLPKLREIIRNEVMQTANRSASFKKAIRR